MVEGLGLSLFVSCSSLCNSHLSPSVCLSPCPSISLLIYLLLCLSMSLSLSLSLFIYPSINRSILLSFYLSIYLSTSPSFYHAIYGSSHPSFYLSILNIHRSVPLFIYLSKRPSIHPFIRVRSTLMLEPCSRNIDNFYLFAHLDLLSADSFASLIFFLLPFPSLTLPTSALPSVRIVGSLISEFPSMIVMYDSCKY